ncbi:MAG TPA: SgcJ/EcaC family oxidoreductase [Acidobacteriaceae bacterium]|nr:SgcJ/EcaC family oxidoreductase [Acidobacteriaceae bacterium]
MSTASPNPATPGTSTVTTESDAQQIRDLVATWARATEACDIEAIKPLMDEDILFLTSGHEPFGSEAFVQRFIGNIQELCPKVRADVREIEVRGDLAFARTWLEVRITPPGSEPITRTGYTLAIYRRRPGGPWKLWRDANLL